MIAVTPIDCTASGVLSSSTAVDYTAYDPATTYAVYVVATGYTPTTACSYAGRNWTSVQAANTGHTPGADAAWWLDDGPSNKMAMFDSSVQTASTCATDLVVALQFLGRFSHIGFMGLSGNTIQIEIQERTVNFPDPTTYVTIYNSGVNTLSASDGTFYSFCFDRLYQQKEASFTNVDCGIDPIVRITITGTNTACGLCVIGKAFEVGKAEYGFNMPIEDRGRSYLDSLGNPVNLDRGYTKGCSGSIVTERGNLGRLNGWLADHIGVPCLWVAAPDQADLVSATVFGRYTRAVPVISNFSNVTLALDIAGYQ